MKTKLVLLLALFGIIGTAAWFVLSPSGPPDSVIKDGWQATFSPGGEEVFDFIQRGKPFVLDRDNGEPPNIGPLKGTTVYPVRVYWHPRDLGKDEMEKWREDDNGIYHLILWKDEFNEWRAFFDRRGAMGYSFKKK